MAVKNDINVALIFVIAVTSALLLAVVLIGVRAFLAFEYDALAAQKGATFVPAELAALKHQQMTNLAGMEWVSDARGKRVAVTIPIERAMHLVAAADGKPTTLPAREPLIEEQPTTAPADQPAGQGLPPQ